MHTQDIRLVVFDWDGTLADTTSTIVFTMQSAITECGFERRDDISIRKIIGLGLEEAARVVYPELSRDDHLLLNQVYRRLYVEQNRGNIRLFPEVKELLDRLLEAGMLLAVATGKSRKGLDNSLNETGLNSCFHASRCADETLSKPHPLMLLEIMKELSVKPENTLMVGDSNHDMQLAMNAGVYAIAVSYGAQKKQDLLKYEPVACLQRPDQLLSWLEGMLK
ncbi:MAG TPA: HAD-IIIA family hydrolase [Gammaproteobacteria bacterium]